MSFSVLLQGLTMGFAYIAPIGMQNLFVIDSASTRRRTGALLAVISVTVFDLSLSLACFFGIGLAMSSIPWLGRAIQLVGGVLVIAIGIGLVIPKRKGDPDAVQHSRIGDGVLKTVATAFIVTWCNPQAIIDGTMLLGASRMTFGDNGVVFMSGVCMASLIWFPSLALVVSMLGKRLNARVLRIINLVCGLVVIAYGVRLLIAFFFAA